jgi:murein biosynthesis integral membrane protein MurJ
VGFLRTGYRQSVAVLLTGAGGVALINMMLAVVAFGKDLVQAAYFGTSPSADALSLAFFIPDTIGNNLMAWAIGVACVPMFAKLLARDEMKRLQRVFLQVTVYTMLLAGLCWLLLYLFQDEVLLTLGSGFTPEVFALCRKLLLVMLPTMVLFPLCMIGSAALQAMGSFAPPAWAPVVFNSFYLGAVAILFALGADQERGAWYTAIGIVAGVVAMVVLVAWAFFKKGGLGWLSWRGRLFADHGDLKRITLTFAPYLLILLCSQLIYTVERHVASLLGSGTIAGLNYAFRLSQFPNWVFVAALTTVLLPAMARAFEQKNPAQVRSSLNRAVKMTLLLTVPISIVLCLARVPIVSLLLQHGSFDEQSLHTTADILMGYSLAIVPTALVAVGLRYYMAVERMRVPTWLALVAFVVTVTFDLLGAPQIGPVALGYGAAMGAWVNAALLMVFVYRDLEIWGKLGAAYESIPDHHSSV